MRITLMLLLVGCTLCGCSRKFYQCSFGNDDAELTEHVDRICLNGERVRISAYYATETSGTNVGNKGFNCLQVTVYPPDDQTAEMNPGRSFINLNSSQLALIQNDKLIGKRSIATADFPNVLNVALYLESGDVFPTGEGEIKLSYRIGGIDHDFTLPCKIDKKREFYVPSLPSYGR